MRAARDVCEGRTDTITSAVFSPDGKRILSGSWNQDTILRDAANGREVNRWSEGGAVFDVAFGRGGASRSRRAATCGFPSDRCTKKDEEEGLGANAVPTALASQDDLVALGQDSKTVTDVWLLRFQ